MATVLAISSEVVRGYVGNSAARFALHALGHEHWALPSIQLSNHPAHTHCAGTPVPPQHLTEMFTALQANGWLDDVDAIMSGYLPTAAHVDVVAECVRTIRQFKSVHYLCDPILGDDPKGLYLNQESARAIRDRLLPLADVVTPNRFELTWLTGHDVRTPEDACKAAAALAVSTVVATSVPTSTPDNVTNLHVETTHQTDAPTATCIDVPRRTGVPHGTGDLLAALYLGHILKPSSSNTAFRAAVSSVAAAIEMSADADELRLIDNRTWLGAPPLPTRTLTMSADSVRGGGNE